MYQRSLSAGSAGYGARGGGRGWAGQHSSIDKQVASLVSQGSGVLVSVWKIFLCTEKTYNNEHKIVLYSVFLKLYYQSCYVLVRLYNFKIEYSSLKHDLTT